MQVTRDTSDRFREVDSLIENIVAKLNSNKAVLASSIDFGRLSWQRDKRGVVRIKIQPEV